MSNIPSSMAGFPAACSVKLQGVDIRYGRTLAVDNVHLDVAPGEILALVGPSGCGKTSLLKAIAGLLAVDQGSVYFDDIRVDQLPPHRRNVGMVFQNYALFPHKRVFENVAFGLCLQRGRGDTAGRASQISSALEMLQIADLARAWPDQLSGGQQQRVALARTLVLRPRVLLLDEPLSALDRQLRDAMRSEIRQLAKKVGITTILVTHDQDEALSMADRIAVMNAGAIEQVGTPRALYDAPMTEFVARFIGRANVIHARCTQSDIQGIRVSIGNTYFDATQPDPRQQIDVGDLVTVLVRPDGLQIGRSLDNTVPSGLVTDQLFMGEKTELRLRLPDGQTLRAELNTDSDLPETGATVSVHVQSLRAFAFRAAGAAERPSAFGISGSHQARDVPLPADGR